VLARLRPFGRPRRDRWLAAHARRVRRGQSLVEFALILPLLLVLLLGIADFGRIFTAGIGLEAAARDAAEIGALERLRNPPPADPSLQPAYYQDLHQKIAEAACDEMTRLPMPDDERAGTGCPHLTAVRVCVHDGTDPMCGQPVAAMDNTPPSNCTSIAGAPSPPWPSTSGGETASHRVEVRLCYQFSTLFNLDLSLPMNTGLSLGDVYLQRTRVFIVDCPPNAVTSC
jgi:hypothetical protein